MEAHCLSHVRMQHCFMVRCLSSLIDLLYADTAQASVAQSVPLVDKVLHLLSGALLAA